MNLPHHCNMITKNSRIPKHIIYFFPGYYTPDPSRSCHNPSVVPGLHWKRLRWIVGWILIVEHFQPLNLSFSALLSPSLPLCVTPAQTRFIWLLKNFALNFFPYNSLTILSYLLSSKVLLRSHSLWEHRDPSISSGSCLFWLPSRWMLPASLFTMGHTRRLLFPLILLWAPSFSVSQ